MINFLRVPLNLDTVDLGGGGGATTGEGNPDMALLRGIDEELRRGLAPRGAQVVVEAVNSYPTAYAPTTEHLDGRHRRLAASLLLPSSMSVKIEISVDGLLHCGGNSVPQVLSYVVQGVNAISLAQALTVIEAGATAKGLAQLLMGRDQEDSHTDTHSPIVVVMADALFSTSPSWGEYQYEVDVRSRTNLLTLRAGIPGPDSPRPPRRHKDPAISLGLSGYVKGGSRGTPPPSGLEPSAHRVVKARRRNR